ncbi:KH domain-containing protein [Trifolium medium]|uniref:KH domain-containing protein n=1 Tax=Trifolium medium TaxID=97028 RepID=A0A392MA52_9FABA|nr:KH domain-containing protein [Trifolium medium]
MKFKNISGSKSAIVTNTTIEIVVPEDTLYLVYGENGSNLARLRQVLRLLSMNLVLEQVTGLLSYLVHPMKPKQHRAFSKHIFLMDHHDISPQGLSSRSCVTY